MSDIVKLIKNYIEARDNYNNEKNKISKLEYELAVIDSEPKTSNFDPNNTGGSFSSDKTLNKIYKKTELSIKIDESRRIFKLYETKYNSLRTEIIETFKDFEDCKFAVGKDKNIFYVFYYRYFKKYVIPFEKIADILNVSTDWVKKLDKEINNILKIYQ